MEDKKNKFGTFGGVFTPCTLTILGVIMFLRFGQVIGNSGILHGLLIILMAKAITTLTTLSLAAIATNTRVKGGGAYYIISRSLGVEFGGAIGLVFFFSQAISVALYIIGFTEALSSRYAQVADNFLLTASLVNFVVFVCIYIGAAWTIKIQYFILAVLGASILSFVIGGVQNFDQNLMYSNFWPQYSESHNIWTMFALFFPAATGIMAGANMSGDLATPAHSIPKGTLLSILATAIVYTVFAIILGSCSDREALLGNSMIVSNISFYSPLIIAGIYAATISSALGSMMGAPRILQAMARDRFFPILNFFIPGSKRTGEPRRATILTFFIAQAGIFIGDLNHIAPIITMFFMITYGALNFAAFQEHISGNPSYRPTFKVKHWSISLAGALLCVGTMLLIDAVWAIVAIITMIAIYHYLAKKEIESNWGDVKSGAALERVRRNLLMLEMEKYHPKNWRPAILAFEMHREQDLEALTLARGLTGKNGLFLLGQVITTEAEDALEKHGRALRMLRKKIADNALDAFPAVTIADNTEQGILSLIQCCGIGALKPNLIIFNWPQNEDEKKEVTNSIRNAISLGKSIALLKISSESQNKPVLSNGTIDVWWLGQSNGTLMLLLAHLLKSNIDWRQRKIRLIRAIKDPAGKENTENYLSELTSAARINAEITVFISDDFSQCLQRESTNACLSILGLPDPTLNPENTLEKLEEITANIPRVLFVYSNGDMSIEV